jgi:hypothetical protein
MALKDYLDKVTQTYSYRFKTLVPLDDTRMTQFEDAIRKYRPCHVDKMIKTPLQSQPLDFGGFQNREVYIVDFTTEIPASAYVLQQDIRQHFGVPEEFVIVRSSNAPTEVESLRINAFAEMDEEAAKMGMRPASLLQQPGYPEAPEIIADRYYGDRYNARLSAVLRDVQMARREQNIDAPSPLIRWENMPKPEDQEPKIPKNNFNDDIPDAPRPASDSKFVDPGKGVDFGTGRSNSNNYDDSVKTYNRVYTDGKKTVTLTRTVSTSGENK